MSKAIIILVLLLSNGLAHVSFARNSHQKIILMIGDGMGLTQLTAAKYAQGTLNMERFAHIGLVTTHSANKLVTDSAAAATALATGYKTKNKMVGLDPQGRRLKTVLEQAEAAGWVTGLVATSSITHATPAAFATHVPKRKQEPVIAAQLTEAKIEVLLGGGQKFFNDDLLARFKAQDYTIVFNAQELQQLTQPKRLLGLFAPEGLATADQRKPSLSTMTQVALKTLDHHQKSFFLMIEGSQIDWEGHSNNDQGILLETADFDQAVGIVLAYQEQHPETLVLITADHETGGFAIHDGHVKEKKITATKFTSRKHTAVMVPVLSRGPGAEHFQGFLDNTDIGQRLIKLVK